MYKRQVNVIGQVTIPAGTPLGTTRMRVQMAYVGNQTELPAVWDGFQWGEVEDYCVVLEYQHQL